jgi:hypothetical protein
LPTYDRKWVYRGLLAGPLHGAARLLQHLLTATYCPGTC